MKFSDKFSRLEYPVYYSKKNGLAIAEKRANGALYYAFFVTTNPERKDFIIEKTRKYLADYPELFDKCFKFVEQRHNEIQRKKLAKI